MLSTLSQTFPGLEFSAMVPSVSSHEIGVVARGLGVLFNGEFIVGEGMGIGGPLALVRNKAVFPLHAESSGSGGVFRKRFHLNGLSEKFVGRAPADVPYKWVRSQLAPLYLKSSRFRPLFYYLMAARTLVGIKSHYRRVESIGYVDVTYHCDKDRVKVDVDASKLEAEKFLIANELDGTLFRHLAIDDRSYVTEIPPWLEIDHSDPRVIAPELHLSFGLRQISGCRIFVGREVLGTRLNWAGVSYVPEPSVDKFSYEVVFEKE